MVRYKLKLGHILGVNSWIGTPSGVLDAVVAVFCVVAAVVVVVVVGHAVWPGARPNTLVRACTLWAAGLLSRGFVYSGLGDPCPPMMGNARS